MRKNDSIYRYAARQGFIKGANNVTPTQNTYGQLATDRLARNRPAGRNDTWNRMGSGSNILTTPIGETWNRMGSGNNIFTRPMGETWGQGVNNLFGRGNVNKPTNTLPTAEEMAPYDPNAHIPQNPGLDEARRSLQAHRDAMPQPAPVQTAQTTQTNGLGGIRGAALNLIAGKDNAAKINQFLEDPNTAISEYATNWFESPQGKELIQSRIQQALEGITGSFSEMGTWERIKLMLSMLFGGSKLGEIFGAKDNISNFTNTISNNIANIGGPPATT